jgi:hypothetical protein
VIFSKPRPETVEVTPYYSHRISDSPRKSAGRGAAGSGGS